MWLLLLLWGWGCVQGVGGAQEEYTLTVKEQVTVQEGLCVHVPCHFSYPQQKYSRDPVHGYWYKAGVFASRNILVATNDPDQQVGEKVKGRFHLLGDLKNNNCSLDIRNARQKDRGSYFFRVEEGSIKWNYNVNKLVLRVAALSQTPDILLPGTLEASRPSNVTCSVPWACEPGAPPIFSWSGASVSSLSSRVTQSAVLTFTPQPQDHGTNLTCQVTLPAANVTTRAAMQLSVFYPPQSLTLMASEGASSAMETLRNGSLVSVQEDQALRLLCAADSYPPARLSWSWGNLSLCPIQPSDPGMLELSPVNLQQGGEFTCQAQNIMGAQHVSVTISSQSKVGALSGVLLGAAGGAGVVTLLFLGFCLLFVLAWSYRRKSARSTACVGGPSAGPGPGLVSQSPRAKSQAEDSSQHQPPKVPSSEEDEIHHEKKDDIHYATLSFHRMKPQDQQENEYSEIQTHT